MIRMYLLLLLLTGISSPSFGQILPGPGFQTTKTGLVKIQQPVILVGHLKTNANSFIIDPDKITIIKTFTDSLEKIPFGEMGKDGVVIAELKAKIPLFRLEDVLDYYKVAAHNRQLRVLVDNRPVDPELFLADVKEIKRLEVIKQDVTSPMRYSWNKDEAFLNIVTAKE